MPTPRHDMALEEEHREAAHKRLLTAAWHFTLIVAILGLLFYLGWLLTTMVRRDRAFEDACLRQGGFTAKAATIGVAKETDGGQVCARVVQSPTYQQIPLPEYKR